MPINFPSSPTSGSQYTYGSKTWRWNGYAWDIVTPTTISTFNGCTSSAITITGTANEVTVDTTCPNIVIGLPNNLVVQNLTVTGSLLVNGGITTQISEVVLIEDNFVTLNANVTAGAPTESAGIIISRGASANVDLRWNETSDNWQFTNNGTDYWDLPINVVNTFNGLTGAVSFSTPLASSSVTGVASFGSEFIVSNLGAVSLTSNYVKSFNGLTGTVSFSTPLASSSATGVASFGNQFVVSAAGAVSLTSNYVSSVNGSTGAITIQGLTGITASVSGQTIRLSHVVTNDNTNFVRYLAFHGVTSGVDTARVDENLQYIPQANSISAYGGLVLQGVSSGGVPGTNQIVLLDPNLGGIFLNSADGTVGIRKSNGGAGDVSSLNLVSFDGLDNGWTATITPATYFQASRTFTLPDDSGVIALTKNVATSVNGATGAVAITGAGAILFTHSGKTGTFNARLASASATGVASFGNEFTVSAAGAVSLTSNYVKSFNGSTGAVTFAVPLASATATGAASFGNEFVVSAAGAVSLTSNYVKSFNGLTGTVSFAVPLASATATGAASFGNEFVVSALGAVSLTSNYVKSFNGSTGAVSFAVPVASSSVTGVASFGNEFVVSALGAVSLTSNYVKSINGSTGAVVSIATTGANTFTGLQTMNGGLTTNHLYVSNGATFNSRATFAGGLTTANLLVSNGATFNSSVLCNTGLSAYGLDILNYQSQPKFDVWGIQIGDVYGVDTGAKIVADFGANYFQFVECNLLASQIYSNDGTLNLQTQGGIPTVNIGDTNGNNNFTCIKIDDNFTRVDINASSDVSIGNVFQVPTSYLRLDNNTKTTTFWNTSISGGDAKFGGIMTLNGGLSAGSGVTFGGRPSFMGGLSANNLYVSQGVTFNSTSVYTGLGTFNGGITSNHLYVSQGVTFAGTVASDTGYRITSNAINSQTGTSYTLTGTDNGKIVTFNNGSAVTVTIPTDLPVGFNCTAIQLGAGQVGFTNAAGLTMQSYGNQYKLLGQHASATIIEYTTNIVNVSGNLTI